MKKDLASHEALMGKTKDGMCEYKNEEKMTREEIQEKYHSPDQPGVMHAMFDEVVDFVIDNYDFKPAFDKKLAMKNFFDTYSNDIEGTLHNMSQDKLLEYLDGDIFIACASAATGIPEKDFVEYSLEYFSFANEAV